jgi:hypothetical protein
MAEPAVSYFENETAADGSAAKSGLTASVRNEIRNILARNASQGSYQNNYIRMYNAWSRGIGVSVAPRGRDFTYCVKHPDTLAYTYVGTYQIFLCKLEVEGYPESHTVQTLIHETAHVAGYENECMATRLERTALRKVGKTPFTNAYVAQCGLN